MGCLGRFDESEICYQKAIKINTTFSEAYFNLSLIQLLRGNYQEGLENYEFRLKKTNPTLSYSKNRNKMLDRKESMQGENLLIIAEQGLGDTLLYMRYVPYLRKQGINISFCAQKKLHSLIQSSEIDLNPLTKDEVNQIKFTKWIPLLSLPRYLHISPKNPIITEPYIFSNEKLITKWKNILDSEKKPIIGINWQGNIEMEKANATYRGRSIPLNIFSILLMKNEITMLSLQKGYGSEQLKNCTFKNKFVKSQSEIDATWDFLENAAIIKNCDLIITNDTSIAHLAGGMGQKVWLILKEVPYWTWGMESSSTFWYPSMRLFRQKEGNNWQEVMERVSIALNKEMEANV